METENNQNQENNEVVIERFKELPKVIQDAIVNSKWEQKIRAIAERNNLVIGDANILETETLLVMLGVTSPSKYAEKLKVELKLDDEKLNNIIASVEEEIFRNIKDRLIEMEEDFNILEKQESAEDDAVQKSEIIINLDDQKNLETIEKKSAEITPNIQNENVSGQPNKDTILEKKLLGTSETPKESISMEPETKKSSSEPVDPYRESIN